MIRGRMTVVGTMQVDGEVLTGAFVECTIDELRNARATMAYQDVVIIPKGYVHPVKEEAKK